MCMAKGHKKYTCAICMIDINTCNQKAVIAFTYA
jgi:hypothetical protein